MTFSDTLVPKAPPLHKDDDGVVRIGGTRVTLDTVVSVYLNGMNAEDIADAFNVLTVAQVHAVISYFLENRNEVDEYLKAREVAAQAIYREIDSKSQGPELKARLLARRKAQLDHRP
ncbi:MAG TPA: DUF433 domain-containing protein [Tepidisphaeraceae bacterium]|nr:DUF433 domain-containing protein [Tepidisphaeraceae bacterium]